MPKMKYHGSVSYPAEGTNSTPFNNNLKEFDEYIGESRKRERAWKTVTLVLLAFLCASLVGWLYVASLPKTVPYVIAVQPWGESKYLGQPDEASKGVTVSDASWRYYLRKFIEYTRGISPDRNLTLSNLAEAYAMTSQTGAAVLTTMLKNENAFASIGTAHREIRLETLIKVSEKSWQADWVEVVLDGAGEELSSVHKRGIYTVEQGTPDEKQIRANPLGIFVDSFQIQDVSQEQG
jgi:type IV secretion system protein TrbF